MLFEKAASFYFDFGEPNLKDQRINNTTIQFFRYAVVGLCTNVLLFCIYLLITALGTGPKIAMTLLYVLGVIMSFVLNRRWSFAFKGGVPQSLIRYIIAYVAGYVLNLMLLLLLVDIQGWPHQYVQGGITFLLAIILFLLQKLWVFKPNKRDE